MSRRPKPFTGLSSGQEGRQRQQTKIGGQASIVLLQMKADFIQDNEPRDGTKPLCMLRQLRQPCGEQSSF
jgi:hypothetical protein